MKKDKINYGVIVAFLLISIFNHYTETKIKNESKISNSIEINAVEVKLEDILTPPQLEITADLVESYIEETSKTR